jgi:predicted N-acetyltransferase YhbS
MSVSDRAPALNLTFAHERPKDAALAADLIDRAFGPGRFVKTAERLRETNSPDLNLSLMAWAGDQAIGCVRLWPILIGPTPALLLGPFAVHDAWRSRGLGGELIQRACGLAQAAGHAVILLVGDEPYFRKLDFHVAPAGAIVMPGPVDSRRVLWRWLKGDAEGFVGGAVTVPPRQS